VDPFTFLTGRVLRTIIESLLEELNRIEKSRMDDHKTAGN